MNITRRNVLKFTGVSAATGLAGCLDSTGEGGNGDGSELPSYHRWLTADDNGEVGYVYVDWSVFEETDTGNQTTNDESDTDAEGDPMIGLPISGAVAAAFVVGFGLSAYGLGGLITYGQSGNETDGSEDLNSSVEAMLLTNRAVVMTGDIDTDAVDEALTAEPEGFSFAKQYEQTDEIGDYDAYTPANEESRDAIAVGDGAILFTLEQDVDDPIAAIRTPIEAAAGDTTRATDEINDFGWLVSSAGRGDLVFGGYGGEFESGSGAQETDRGDNFTDGESGGEEAFDMEHTELDGLEGGVSSLSFGENRERATGKFAALLGDADAGTLEASLASSATESTVEIKDGRVTASATWESLE
ncbi:hypothetical protein [Natrinema salinisoli]|uniref:hypothetical protein n=1 Tax=Natrinema salinisoli TaxID=2878535 RepID=UPI001CEFD0E1|nr:hypothetical protein [Natrinema salinisoli]